MFFERFSELCEERKISRYKAVLEAGLSRSVVDRWRDGRLPTAASLSKLAEYFEVSVDYLIETQAGAPKVEIQGEAPQAETQKETPKVEKQDENIPVRDLYAAFFHNPEELTEEEMAEYWEDARDFVRFKIEQKRMKKAKTEAEG